MKVFERLYKTAAKMEQVPPAPEGASEVVNVVRLPAWDQFTTDAEGSVAGESGDGLSGTAPPQSGTLRLPKEQKYHSV